jgi:hypothetical protein
VELVPLESRRWRLRIHPSTRESDVQVGQVSETFGGGTRNPICPGLGPFRVPLQRRRSDHAQAFPAFCERRLAATAQTE